MLQREADRTTNVLIFAGLVIFLVVVISYDYGKTGPIQNDALKMYEEKGKEACQEGLALATPVLQEEDIKRLRTEVEKIDLSAEGATPLIAIQHIFREYESAQREKGVEDKARVEKLENLYRAISGAA